MMNSPYFGFPYYNRYSRYGYRYPYYNNSSSYNSTNNNNSNSNNKPCENNKSYNSKEKSESNSFSKLNKINSNNNSTNCSDEDTENPMFEIFGIKLFFDDILLIALIFFLYTEGVKDQNLFISLVLLLLS